MKKKIIHLSSAHSQFDVRIFHKECSELSRKYDITLIAPGDENSRIDNINLISLGSRRDRIDTLIINPLKILLKTMFSDGDIFHIHDPVLILPGLILGLTGKKIVYDVHEDYEEIIKHKNWIPSFFRKIFSEMFGRIENIARKRFQGFVTVNNAIYKKFPQDKTVIVGNYPQWERFISSQVISKKKIRIITMGSLSPLRGAKEFYDASMKMAENDVQFEICGEIRECKIQNNGIIHRAAMPYEIIPKYLQKVSIGLILYRKIPNHINCLPHKLFEFMAAGIPVITNDLPEISRIVKEHDCGLVINIEEEDALLHAIQFLIENPMKIKTMGQNGKNAVRENYKFEDEIKKLFQLYEKI